MEKAIKVFSHHLGEDHQYISVMLNNIGMAYGNLGETEKQKGCLLKAYKIRKESLDPCHAQLFEVRHNLVLCLTTLLNYNQASEILNKAFSCLSPQIPNYEYQFIKLQTAKVNLEIAKARKSKQEEYGDIYLTALAEVEETVGKYHQAAKDLYNNTGVYFYEKEDAEKAVYYLESAIRSYLGYHKDSGFRLPNLEELKSINQGDLTLYTNLGSAYFNLYKSNNDEFYLDRSFEAFLLCDKIVETLKINILQGDSRRVVKERTRHSFIMSNRTSFELYQLRKKEKYLEHLFSTLEKIKSWELLEKYAYTNAAKNAKNAVVQSQINHLKDQLLFGDVGSISDSLEIELNFLLEKLKVEHPEYYQQLYGNQIISLNQLKILCRQKEEQWLIYFQLPEHQFSYLLVQADTIILGETVLDSKELENLKDGLFKNLSDKDWDFRLFASELYEILIARIHSDFEDKRLVIQAHHQILDLPFELLVKNTQMEKDSSDYFHPHYFIYDYDISYMHSASIAFQLKDKLQTFKSPVFLAPDYASVDLKLDWSQIEIKQGRKHIHGKAYTDISKSMFEDLLQRHDHFHFAGHVFNSSRIDSTYILLKDGKDLLYLNEITELNSNANLLVLSACNTGVGKSSPEALISPAYTFSFAGSPNIISSLWKTRDESSARLFDHFYRYLKEGFSSVAALRKAKVDYIRNAPLPEKHPIYWASFTHYGNEVFYQPSSLWRRYLLISSLIAILFLLLMNRNRWSSSQS
jgi:CHAT domain-containing protein